MDQPTNAGDAFVALSDRCYSAAPTTAPTPQPTLMPTARPSTVSPTSEPTAGPTAGPTAEPTAGPTAEPIAAVTGAPTSVQITCGAGNALVGAVCVVTTAACGQGTQLDSAGGVCVPDCSDLNRRGIRCPSCIIDGSTTASRTTASPLETYPPDSTSTSDKSNESSWLVVVIVALVVLLLGITAYFIRRDRSMSKQQGAEATAWSKAHRGEAQDRGEQHRACGNPLYDAAPTVPNPTFQPPVEELTPMSGRPYGCPEGADKYSTMQSSADGNARHDGLLRANRANRIENMTYEAVDDDAPPRVLKNAMYTSAEQAPSAAVTAAAAAQMSIGRHHDNAMYTSESEQPTAAAAQTAKHHANAMYAESSTDAGYLDVGNAL